MTANQSWIDALRQRGAQIEGNLAASFDAAHAPARRDSNAVSLCPLLSRGLIAAEDPDAGEFLQGQLTNDIGLVSSTQAQSTAYCTAKGRVLTTLLLVKRDAAFFLVLPGELAESVRKRLQMYVLRSRVRLSDASAQKVLLGLAGASAPTLLRQGLGLTLSSPYQTAEQDGIVAVALPGARVLLMVDAERAPAVWDRLAQDCAAAPEAVWDGYTIAAGVPVLTATTTDRFIPQMLNLELLGAVSFRKGCYTGQEIVARTEHLGQVKRRLFRFLSAQALLPGDAILSAVGEAGTVISCAPSPSGGFDLLAVVATDAAGGLLLAADGAPLKALRLPYSLPDVATIGDGGDGD